MNLSTQKRLAADILKCSPSKVILNEEYLNEIKDSITKFDLRSLIKKGYISKKTSNGPSKVRARKIATQKAKGKRKGFGSRKGRKTARSPRKTAWMIKIRKQRNFLKELKDKEIVGQKEYRSLYRKSKGGFFRNLRHIKIYISEINKK